MARWRMVLLHRSGATIAVNVTGAARLLAAQQWAARLHRRHTVDDWTWWRLWQPAPAYLACPRCSWEYLPGCISIDTCRCGLLHVRYECRAAAGHTHTLPPRHDGCGPLPHDPETGKPARRLKARPR